MINFSAFEFAHQIYPRENIPFLSELAKTVYKDKRYDGLKILHNIPLTIEAVLKIEVLALGGADITASCITVLPPSQAAIDILTAANIKVQIEHKFDEDYDICLDCCGELIDKVAPRIGAVELTQTGSEIYKNRAASLNYPVLSVDDSKLKVLETFFGTGDGFIRALKKNVGREIYDKKFVVFGGGKVGRGIINALLTFTDDIIVIDVHDDVKKFAMKKGIKAIDGTRKDLVKDIISQAYVTVTATGVKNLISNFYGLNKADFGNALLINMGAEDEYGNNFLPTDVLFEKKPFNFSISEPTTIKYLDPIFYAHNLGIDFVRAKEVKPGYNPFPEKSALEILRKWIGFHNDYRLDLSEILT
jgi:adenosylhomocysteinase